MPITLMRKYERSLTIHKMVNGLTKHTFQFDTNFDFHARATRQSNQIYIQNPFNNRTEISGHLALALSEYNALPDDIKRIESLDTFKRQLKILYMTESGEFSTISPFKLLN